jgi:hypothetical protein
MPYYSHNPDIFLDLVEYISLSSTLLRLVVVNPGIYLISLLLPVCNRSRYLGNHSTGRSALGDKRATLDCKPGETVRAGEVQDGEPHPDHRMRMLLGRCTHPKSQDGQQNLSEEHGSGLEALSSPVNRIWNQIGDIQPVFMLCLYGKLVGALET